MPSASCTLHARTAGLALTVMLALVASAGATSVVRMTDEQLVQQAELIVEARVTALTGEWNSRHTQIVTRVDLDVSDVLKGAPPGPSMQLYVLGGVVGDTAMAIIDSPDFTLGQTSLLLLNGNPRSLFPVVGFNQGKFTYEADAVTGAVRVRERDADRTSFVQHIRDLVGR